LTTNRSLRIYTKLVGTSRTENDSNTNPENCLGDLWVCGRSVIGVLRILTNPEICQFLAIFGFRGRSVIGALEIVTGELYFHIVLDFIADCFTAKENELC